MEISELSREVEVLHFPHFEVRRLASLALVECCVVIGHSLDPLWKMLLGELAHVSWGLATINKDQAILGALLNHGSLVFFDWSKKQDDGVVKQRKGLAGLPLTEQRIDVDLVLALWEDAGHGDVQLRITAPSICDNDGSSFAGQLDVLIF